MIHQDRLIAVLSEFARTLTATYDITDALYHLADNAMQVLDAVGAGVSLADESGRLSAVTTRCSPSTARSTRPPRPPWTPW